MVNAISIPYLSAPGLRLGVQELTFAGLDRAGAAELAVLMACAVIHRDPPESVAHAVAALRARYLTNEDQHAAEELAHLMPNVRQPEARTP